jgi:hypothetical protein
MHKDTMVSKKVCLNNGRPPSVPQEGNTYTIGSVKILTASRTEIAEMVMRVISMAFEWQRDLGGLGDRGGCSDDFKSYDWVYIGACW